MKIALVQQQPPTDFDASLRRGLDAYAEAAANGADLVVFPELAFTPFYPQHEAGPDALGLAEPIPGPTTEAFQEAARDHGAAVVLNLYERAGDGSDARAYDTSPVIDAQGRLRGRTRMLHITDYEGFREQGYYAPGEAADGKDAAPVYDLGFGRIGVAICYDRHFPEVLRAYALAGADLVVVPQAGTEGEWPDGLFEAELRVGAFQNGFFMALANRVGTEDALTFDGGSFVADPFGQLLVQAPRGEEAVLYADLDLAACEEAPARKLFLKHRRPALYEGGAVRAPRPEVTP